MPAIHATILAWALSLGVSAAHAGDPRVLVYTRTAGFRHDSIPDGVAMVQRLGALNCFEVVHTEDAALFSPASLASFAAVVFLCTTGDVLPAPQQQAFEAWMAGAGGSGGARGWVGIHSAADTEYDWPYFGQMLGGAYFVDHPAPQTASVIVEVDDDPSTRHLSTPWVRFDEWYNFRASPRLLARVLLSLDESTYAGGTMGDHPIAWSREMPSGGRAWYTAGGHTRASYTEPDFERHVLGGILWAAAFDQPDCNANGAPDRCDIALGRSRDLDANGVPDECTRRCPADINGIGGLSVQDLFDFLQAFFASDTVADFNGDAQISVEDVFDYLAAYFRECA